VTVDASAAKPAQKRASGIIVLMWRALASAMSLMTSHCVFVGARDDKLRLIIAPIRRARRLFRLRRHVGALFAARDAGPSKAEAASGQTRSAATSWPFATATASFSRRGEESLRRHSFRAARGAASGENSRTALALAACDWRELLKNSENKRSRKSRFRTPNLPAAGHRHTRHIATRGKTGLSAGPRLSSSSSSPAAF
jgi:hypothetical protein